MLYVRRSSHLPLSTLLNTTVHFCRPVHCICRTRSMGPSTHLLIDRSGTTTPHASIHHYSYIASIWWLKIGGDISTSTETPSIPLLIHYHTHPDPNQAVVGWIIIMASRPLSSSSSTRTCITMAISVSVSGTYYSIIYLAVCNVIWDIVSCVRSLVLWYGSPKWEYYGMVWWGLWIEFSEGDILDSYYPSW